MILSSQRRLEGKRVWVAAAVAGLTVAGLWWRLGAGGQEPSAPGQAVLASSAASAPGWQTWQQGGTGGQPGAHASGQAPWALPGQPWMDPARLDVTQRFKARDGRLVIDASTLRTLEQVLIFQDGQGAGQKAREVAHNLPPELRTQAAELAERYAQFDQARRMAVSPDQAPASLAQMQSQFDAVQALQREHFGQDVAQQLFGEDDAVTARLLQFMAEDTDPTASLQDKAMRAQARYSADLQQATRTPSP